MTAFHVTFLTSIASYMYSMLCHADTYEGAFFSRKNFSLKQNNYNSCTESFATRKSSRLPISKSYLLLGSRDMIVLRREMRGLPVRMFGRITEHNKKSRSSSVKFSTF